MSTLNKKSKHPQLNPHYILIEECGQEKEIVMVYSRLEQAIMEAEMFCNNPRCPDSVYLLYKMEDAQNGKELIGSSK